jgi:peptidyl-prolyl cis-trans isomerase A (cyclophilin A)
MSIIVDGNQKADVQCSTSAGNFSLRLQRRWSPNGYDRALELFDRGFFDNSHFFRVVPGFLVQFGISYTQDQELNRFANALIPDDPQLEPRIKFDEGVVSFAGSGPNSRTSNLFIAYGAIPSLGTQLWETPIGTVVEGIETIRNLNHEYGDMPPWGNGPEQHKIRQGGISYIEEKFPHLDQFIECKVVKIQDGMGNNEMPKSGNLNEEKGIQKIDLPKHVRKKRMTATGVGHERLEESQESDHKHLSTDHVAIPITAAFTFFCVLMYVMKKGKRKVTAKSK